MSIAEKLITIAENEQRVYERGKQAEYDTFWDVYQENGSRLNYNYAFAGTGWTEKVFCPKFNFKPTGTYCMFYNNKFAGDLVQRLEECGVSLDLSRVNDGTRTFMYATKITRIGSVNVSLAPSINEFFSWCTSLVTIDELTITETTTSGTNMFLNCYELQNIVFSGIIGFNIGLPQSTKLTKASIQSIVSHLSDTTSGKTLTLSKTAVNNAFETASGTADGSTSEEWLNLVATKPNWTISLS